MTLFDTYTDIIVIILALAAVVAISLFFGLNQKPEGEPAPAPPRRRGMPLMWNGYIFAVLAISVLIGAILVNGKVSELNDMAWGAVGSILTMLTMGFSKVVETNIYLIRREAGGGSVEGDDD